MSYAYEVVQGQGDDRFWYIVHDGEPVSRQGLFSRSVAISYAKVMNRLHRDLKRTIELKDEGIEQ